MQSYPAFIEAIMHCGDIDRASATIVADYYLANKIAKAYYDGSSINVTHGAFLDRDIILNALNAAREA